MFAALRQHPGVVLCGLALALASAGLVLRADEPPKKNGKTSSGAPDTKTEKTAAAKPDSDAKAAKPGTAKVERGPFHCEVTLKGVFESPKMAEVSVRLEAQTPLLVATVVEPGTTVKKGDVLLTFDAEKVDRALRDLEAEKELADLTLKQAEEELPLLEHGAPLELASAARAKKEADEDLKHFLQIDRGWEEKSAKFMVKNYSDYLEYAKEELKQLQKMYRNKDLTEETEEIILKRQRNRVEMMSFFVDEAAVQRDHALAFEIPRREQMLRDGSAKADLALEKAKTTLPLTLSQKRLALAKARYDRARSAEHLDRVRHDREVLTVKSPADGVVYYGRCIRGQWVTASDIGRRLVRGGAVQPEEVFITVVDPAKLLVRATVDEKELATVTPGAVAKVTPTALPDTRLPAKVKDVLSAPLGAGAFDARLELEGSKAPALTAGMTCTARLVHYRKADALTVPVAAVFHDEDEAYVYVDGKDKSQKRTVKAGHTSGERVEILEGLHEGDVVRLTKP
jgi:HlyD family secretion protein